MGHVGVGVLFRVRWVMQGWGGSCRGGGGVMQGGWVM